ncbi:hypothetical protein [Reyranella sp.]|uniref:hypothetical protein n=1 Tax=Reyranella sp. TaxID=1929291 RepID=UPI00272FADB1|nr:hypothetical protein [Reyranella sp.]MDP2376093.1 hypothetical protein [Reyranella sp.]
MSQPFLGYTNDVDKAFPGIRDFRVTVTEDPGGYYVRDAAQRMNVYTKGSAARVHRCANPQCQQGGLDIQRLVLFSGPGSHAISCPGHDGSPKGRRKGDQCDNHFDVTIEIERE